MRRALPAGVVAAAVAVALAGTLPAASGAPDRGRDRERADCALPGADGPLPTDNRKRWWGDEGVPTDWDRFVRPEGTVRAVMLFVDFPNARAEDNAAPYQDTRAYRDFLAPGADWLERSSDDELRLRITAVPKWYRMPRPDSEYGIARNMPLQTQAAYLREAVQLADADVDFDDYDLVYVVPSRNATAIALSPAYVDGGRELVEADGTAIAHGVTFGRDMWSWGYKILVHETLHTFGLPDLYLEPGDTHAAVRGWDLMGNIAGRAPDLLAWHKWKLDWVRDRDIDCITRSGTSWHRIRAVEREGGTKAVVVRTGLTTAYVLESRRRTGLDAEACSEGVLVYEIDSPLRSGEGPVRVVDATPGSAESPGCRDLDIATLSEDGASTLTLPGGVRIDLVRQSRYEDTVRVTKAPPPGEPAERCAITRPPEGWPDGTSAGFDTNLHHGIDSDWRLHVRPVGTVRAIMLFVDFPNARAEDNAAPYADTQPYHDFLAPGVEWFRRSSYGRLDLDITPVPRWFRLARPDNEYGLSRSTFTIENQLNYVREVVQLADPEVDFRGYDLLYIVPSRNARNVAFSPEFNDYSRAIVADRTVLKNGATYGQDMWNWGFKILNHETGHAFSLPESYNASGVGGTHRFVGGWDMMGNISGRAPELMAWNKWKLDWLDRSQVECVTRPGVTEHTLTPIELGGDRRWANKMVVVRTGRYTAWVAELRRNAGNDAGTICDPGLLVYRLDASIPNGDGSIVVHDAKPNSGRQGPCTELDIGTFGLGAGEPAVFQDPATGVTIEVVRDREHAAVVRVVKQ